MGIPPEKARNIFDRFVKLNDFVSGTGLGLAISKMIVEKLDGTIGVDSEPGKGTRFHFSIPVVHRDGSKNDEQLCAAPGRDDGKSWVLLVAEDSDTNFRLIEAVLSRRFSLVRAHTEPRPGHVRDGTARCRADGHPHARDGRPLRLRGVSAAFRRTSPSLPCRPIHPAARSRAPAMRGATNFSSNHSRSIRSTGR